MEITRIIPTLSDGVAAVSGILVWNVSTGGMKLYKVDEGPPAFPAMMLQRELHENGEGSDGYHP